MTTEVAAAAVVRHGRVLVARRTGPADVAGGWELPGGKVDPGEIPAQAVVREVHEELGCRVEVVRPLIGRTPIKPGYELTAHLCRLVCGEPAPREHDAVRWLGPEDLDDVDWLAADQPFLAELHGLLLDGTRLPGGNVGGAVRVGVTVRRPAGPWTSAVHGLLGHLSRRGVAEVPQVHGFDERGREVLSYLPGRVLDPDREAASDALLADAIRWLRRFHDAVSEAGLPGPWRDGTDVSAPGQLVCHNDFAPYSVSVSTSADGERLVGVFDWDLAGPATRLEDLAFAAWNWVPMWLDMPAAWAARRLELMARSYAAVSGSDIAQAVAPRVRKSLDVIRSGQASGDAGMLNLALIGEPDRTSGALADLRLRVPGILAALREQ